MYSHCSQQVRGSSIDLPEEAPVMQCYSGYCLTERLQPCSKLPTLLEQTWIRSPGQSLTPSLFDSCGNWAAGSNACLHVKHDAKPAEKRQGRVVFCALFYHQTCTVLIVTQFCILKVKTMPTQICIVIYWHVRVHVYFMEEDTSLLFFFRKGSILFYVTLLISFSLVSGQITSGYPIFCMACKCDQMCHFIRHSPFQTPGEVVSTDDFHSSGKAVTHHSASVPAHVRTWMLETVAQILEQAAVWHLKNTEQLHTPKNKTGFYQFV